jgi:16S rRNA (uracil1498-N3)-methyltransferase
MSSPRQRKGGCDEREATKPDARSSRGQFSPRFFLAAAHALAAASVEPSSGDRLMLSAEDSHHALKVLRLRVGDRCEVVSPARKVYQAVVSSTVAPLELSIVGVVDGDDAGPVYLREVGLVQAVARPGVMDYVLEKGTEVGADFFVLVEAAGSPRRSEVGRPDRLERWRRIAQEAAKQSKQTRVPWVATYPTVSEALGAMQLAGSTNVVLDLGASRSLPRVMAEVDLASRRICLWIGPESGWTADELDVLSAGDVDTAKLGRSVLRTETAGPVAVAITRLALQDW